MNSNNQLMLVIAEIVSFFSWRFSGGFFIWSNEELQRETAFSAYTEQRMRKHNLEAAMIVNWPSLHGNEHNNIIRRALFFVYNIEN
jgi:hypothetical protein